MSGAAVPLVDVALGMNLVYMTLSLVVTATTELIATLMHSRAKMLREGIGRLLQDPTREKEFFEHPLVQALGQSSSKPASYIPSRTFVQALLDTLAPIQDQARDLTTVRKAVEQLSESNPSTPGKEGSGGRALKRSLGVLLSDAGERVEDFEAAVETWFNNTMERTSGWYKRQTQWVTLAIALVVTIGVNADTVRIVQSLWREPAVRSALVSQAEALSRAGAPSADAKDSVGLDAAERRFDDSLDRLHGLPIPVGWAEGPSWAVLAHIPGWILTICAISLGAPFWFDTLNRIIGIRGAGKAPEEKQKAPKEVPKPAEPGVVAAPAAPVPPTTAAKT